MKRFLYFFFALATSFLLAADGSHVSGEEGQPAPKLRYGWKTGDQLDYKITIKVQLDDEIKKVDAWCHYEVGDASLIGAIRVPHA